MSSLGDANAWLIREVGVLAGAKVKTAGELESTGPADKGGVAVMVSGYMTAPWFSDSGCAVRLIEPGWACALFEVDAIHLDWRMETAVLKGPDGSKRLVRPGR